MIVLLLRHGVAEDHAPGGDAARRLTADGIAKLERAAPAWQRLVAHVDRLYVSPLVRAQQTADLFAAAVGDPGDRVTTDAVVPGAPEADILEQLLGDVRQGLGTAAVVGHETHLGRLLGALLGLGRALPLKKGMLVGVELDPRRGAGMLFCLSAKLAGQLDARDA